MRRVAAALVHYPVLNREGAEVTAAITNIDLHDIARSAVTFGLTDLFVVHPVAAQRVLAERIRSHWVEGSGGRRIPDRRDALGALRIVAELEDALSALGADAELWVTSARGGDGVMPHARAREVLMSAGPPVLIAFGTGWGLAPTVTARAQARLAPILSPRPDGYNHLSVRAAAAIYFDRLLGAAR